MLKQCLNSAPFLIALTAAFTLWAVPAASQQKSNQPVTAVQAAAPADPPEIVSEQKAQTDGIPLTVNTVSGSVSVDAVLLPYSLAKRSFGKEVADKYAVVSLIVSNRDQKQGMILHSIVLDYSQWLFSGIFSGLTASAKVSTESWNQQNSPSQVASAEVRTVRTDFQDAQMWSTRNWVIHIATAVGATASSLTYSTASDLFLPSVSAFNGNVVPALSLIWPDNSQTQLNLLNDIGFRTNRVISAKSSDVVIAFFPVERFLTPTLRKIYKKAPAAFFNPSELLFEKDSGNSHVGVILKRLAETGLIMLPGNCQKPPVMTAGSDLKSATDVPGVQCALTTAVLNYEHAYEKARLATAPGGTFSNPCIRPVAPLDSEECTAVELLNRVSLNNIRVMVGGAMTVDAAMVPATISSVTIANEGQSGTWSPGQTLTGTLNGSFLSGGTIVVTGMNPAGASLDAATLGAVTVAQKSASDISLPFSVTEGGSSPIATGSRLLFTVTKVAQDRSTTVSSPYTYTVTWAPQVSVSGTPDWTEHGKFDITITGAGLTGATVQAVSGNAPNGVVLPAGNFTPQKTGNSSTVNSTVTILGTAVPPGSVLNFVITGTTPSGAASSMNATYTVPAAAPAATAAATPATVSKH